MRALGPFTASSLFAFSVSHRLWRGNFVFVVMVLLALVGAGSTFALHEGGRASAEEEEEENS